MLAFAKDLSLDLPLLGTALLLLIGLAYWLLAREKRRYSQYVASTNVERETWRLLRQSNQDAGFDWDLQNRRFVFNQRWNEVLGFDSEECLDGKTPWQSLVHPDDRQRVEQALANYFSKPSGSCHL